MRRRRPWSYVRGRADPAAAGRRRPRAARRAVGDAAGGRPAAGQPGVADGHAPSPPCCRWPPAAARPLSSPLVVLAGVMGQVLVSGGAPATFASFVAVMICVYTLVREARPVAMAAGLVLIAAAVTVDHAPAGARRGLSQPFDVRLPARLLRAGRWARGLRAAAGAAAVGGRGPRRGAGGGAASARRSWPRPRSGPGSPASCTTSSPTA